MQPQQDGLPLVDAGAGPARLRAAGPAERLLDVRGARLRDVPSGCPLNGQYVGTLVPLVASSRSVSPRTKAGSSA